MTMSSDFDADRPEGTVLAGQNGRKARTHEFVIALLKLNFDILT